MNFFKNFNSVKPKPILTEATGVAMARNRTLGPKLEAAMAAEINKISAECEEIWANDKLSDEMKRELIGKRNEPAEVRRRIIAAKNKAKAALGA
jgi:hypothetical protein